MSYLVIIVLSGQKDLATNTENLRKRVKVLAGFEDFSKRSTADAKVASYGSTRFGVSIGQTQLCEKFYWLLNLYTDCVVRAV